MKTSALPRALALLVGCSFAASAGADEPAAAVPVAAVPVAVGTAVPVAAETAVAAPRALRPAPSTAKATTMAKPLVATIQLSNGTSLSGNLMDSTGLSMKTSFGEVVFPFSEVAGVKMASEGNPVTTVVLLNGDSITGAADMARLEVQTEWGKVEINGPNVGSLLFAQGLKWVSASGLNGSRWGLVAETPLVPTAKQTATNAKPAPPAPGTTGAPSVPATPQQTFAPAPVTRAGFFGR